jgi:hypothetical protein
VADEVGGDEPGAAGDEDVFYIRTGRKLRGACKDWLREGCELQIR